MSEASRSYGRYAQEPLVLPAALFGTLLEIADDAVVVIDESQQIAMFNHGAEHTFGYRAADAIGQPLTLLLPGDAVAAHGGYIATFANSVQSARRMGERGEIRARRADGEIFLAEASIAHLRIGGTSYFAAILRDVSERKRAEIALQASEARFRALSDSSPVGVLQTDASGGCVYVNDRWCDLAGMSATEAMGDGWIRALHPDDRTVVFREWKRATAAGEPFRAEYRFVLPDGRETWVLANAEPIRAELGAARGYVGTITDITERRIQAAALEAAKTEAETAARAKSLFLANMSHEIRTPLNAVIGMTSLLLETPISAEQKDFAQTIRASGETLLAIINDILDFSKADVGKLELERQVFDLRRAIEDVLDLFASAVSDKGLNLAYYIEEGTPESLVGDVTRLRQILSNLVSNAVKFTHHGEVVITVAASHVDNGRHRVHFAVRDTGIGIPADRMTHLFQSFSQVDASTTRKYGGTGLGLAISKRLAELMGGTAWAESTPGAGSTFHFVIEADPGPRPDHHYLRHNPPALAGKRLLIVDDNMTNRRILVKQSLLWGMLPSATPSAAEALDLVRHDHPFDVALLDMGMPEMDGLDLAWEIRKHRAARELPIIMLTSMGARFSLPSDADLALAAHLTKPIKVTQLFGVLSDVLADRSQTAAAPAPLTVREEKLAERLPLRILVAEDNVVNQKVVLRLLARLGYRADIAANGLEVLDALDRQDYDLIFMDVQMPELDGISTTERIFKRYDRHQAPRVIAMTANAMPGDRENCLAVGMDAYLTKPVDLDQLRAALLGLDERRATNGGDARSSLDRKRLDYLAGIQNPDQPGLVRELIDLFVADSPTHLDRLRAAVAARDGQALRQAAHRFKSSVENLGALRMTSLCDEIESAGRGNDFNDGTQALVTQLAHELDRVCTLLGEARHRY